MGREWQYDGKFEWRMSWQVLSCRFLFVLGISVGVGIRGASGGGRWAGKDRCYMS